MNQAGQRFDGLADRYASSEVRASSPTMARLLIIGRKDVLSTLVFHCLFALDVGQFSITLPFLKGV